MLWARRADLGPKVLRGLLASALASRGHGQLVVEAEIPWPPTKREPLPGFLTATVLWGLGVSAGFGLGLPLYLWWMGVIVVFIVMTIAIKINETAPAFAMLAAWVGVVVMLAMSGDWLVRLADGGAGSGDREAPGGDLGAPRRAADRGSRVSGSAMRNARPLPTRPAGRSSSRRGRWVCWRLCPMTSSRRSWSSSPTPRRRRR